MRTKVSCYLLKAPVTRVMLSYGLLDGRSQDEVGLPPPSSSPDFVVLVLQLLKVATFSIRDYHCFPHHHHGHNSCIISFAASARKARDKRVIIVDPEHLKEILEDLASLNNVASLRKMLVCFLQRHNLKDFQFHSHRMVFLFGKSNQKRDLCESCRTTGWIQRAW